MNKEERVFWARADCSGDGCWEWEGTHNGGRHHYGRLGKGNGRVLAHRQSWLYAHGPIPPGLSVLHRCDNPPCIRPSHLFLGTHTDNMRDAAAKGRLNRLNRAGAKLTWAQACAIRLLVADHGWKRKDLASLLGMTPASIERLVRFDTYREAA